MTVDKSTPELDTTAGKKIYQRITELLDGHGVSYRVIEHPPVFTMEEADVHMNGDPEQSVKSLFVKVKRSGQDPAFVLAALPGTKRLDFKLIARSMGGNRASMASDDDVKQRLRILPGALAPLGYQEALPVYVDADLLSQEELYINPGLHDRTIVLGAAGLLLAIQDWAERVVVSEPT